MTAVELKVSHRGQMALPAEARHRWKLDQGGTVQIADLGDALLVVPAAGGRLHALLREAVAEAGGDAVLASRVTEDDPGLA